MLSGMGNEVSAEEGGKEEGGEEEGEWASMEETEASGGLWSLSHDVEDGEEVCVFACAATSAVQTQLCLAGAEHLRLLRHPNILKFLNYDLSPVILVTEPVLPIRSVMSDMCVEGMVKGWRGVAQGLIFLHDKAKLSHNSLCSECVYTCVNTSQWKIGGFEAAAQHSKIDDKFIELIATVRPPNTVPPEDKSPNPESSRAVPCHSRDVWAFAHLILLAVEESGLDSEAGDSMYTYIQQHMLNPDPSLRPTVCEMLTQQWMRNDATEISEFLGHLTVKTQAQKDEFFGSLPPRLHSLPPHVVAEHLVPLLLTPLVMAEPEAHRTLWPHLLTPESALHPKRLTFDPACICPLLEKELFCAHAVPLLLNLMESHDYHVRMVLLEHLLHFSPLCPESELTSSLLPEVLVGLHDVHDEMVQATLRALADLVELVGGETVMGTPRSNIFVDATPRSKSIAMGKTSTATPHAPPTSLLSPSPSSHPHSSPSSFSHPHPSPSSHGPSQEELRKQRAERMREKREMQRQKKMAAGSKLGVASSTVDVETNGGVESDELTTPPGHAQYSPSVSHDEEEREHASQLEEDGEGFDEEQWEEFAEDGEGEEWEEFAEEEEGEVGEEDQRERDESDVKAAALDSGLESGWSLSGSQTEREKKASEEGKLPRMPSIRTTGSLNLGGRGKTSSEDRRTGKGASRRGRPGGRERGRGSTKPTGKGASRTEEAAGSSRRGRPGGRERGRGSTKPGLSEEDRQRLEEQEAWAKEPDFFADMTPSVAKSSSAKVGSHRTSEKASAVADKMATSVLQYQATEVEEGGAWGDWNDF